MNAAKLLSGVNSSYGAPGGMVTNTSTYVSKEEKQDK